MYSYKQFCARYSKQYKSYLQYGLLLKQLYKKQYIIHRNILNNNINSHTLDTSSYTYASYNKKQEKRYSKKPPVVNKNS